MLLISDKKLSYRWQTARRVQRSVNVTKHGTIPYVRYGFLFVCYSNFIRKIVEDIRLQKCRDLENHVKGPWRSLKMSPFDREPIYDFLLMFYGNYGSISCRFWDIQCRKISWPWNPSQEPIKVIESGIIR